MRIKFLFTISFVFCFLLVKPIFAQTSGIECNQETITACYEKGLELFQAKDFEKAKIFFEKVVALNVSYKQATAYLKKCYRNLASEIVNQNVTVQRQKEKEKREQERLDKGQAMKLERERMAFEKAQAKKDKEELRKQKAAKKKEEEAALEKGDAEGDTAEDRSLGVNPNVATVSDETLVPAYRIGAGDVLEVSVWRVPELEKIVIVGPDGTFSLPLVGRVAATGLSITELTQQLTTNLKEYLRTPQVSIAIQRFGGTKVIVMGEVKGPGILAVPGGSTLIDVIAMAGGFTNDAIKRGVILIRGGLGQPQIYRLNALRIFKGDMSQNITLASNDILYVPRKSIVSLATAMTRMVPILSDLLLGTSTYRDLKKLPN